MPDSVREQILKDVVTTLQGMNLTSGYELEFVQVLRVPKNPFSLNAFPTAMVVDVSEEKHEGSPSQLTTCVLHLQIVCWNKEYDDISEESVKVLANVEKVLGVDITRGGLAYNTQMVSNNLMLADELEPYGGVTLAVDILYRHLLHDPFTQ